MMEKMCLMLIVLIAAGSVMAGTITKSTTPPTYVFASGPVGPSFTRIFADGARTSDYNEGRGNEIISDSGYSYAGYTMSALVVRKDGNQDFTGSTATLTLYVFEGTKEMWDLGIGQSATNSDPFAGTGITTIYTETFPLNGNYAEGDYITLELANPIDMSAQMNWFIKMDKGNSANTYFQIAQLSSNTTAAEANGYQYQSPSAGNFYTASPLEYYAVGVNNNVATNVSPTGDAVDPIATTTISWDPPLGYTPEVGYSLIVRKPVQATEPNFADTDNNLIEITNATASSPTTYALEYGTTYWCQVTAYEPNIPDDIPHSLIWSFTTLPADIPPIVTLDNYVTWPDFLPLAIDGTVDDSGEGDLEPAQWEIIAGPGIPVAADMKMISRTKLYNIKIDPDLFRDWIGTDSSGANEANSDVMTLTLSGLPAGDYTWTSYHFDADLVEVGATGEFDVTVTDSVSSTTTTGVPQYSGPIDVPPFMATITSDGSDVTLQFVGSDDGSGLFMMNAFELTSTNVTGDPLLVDFGPDPINLVQTGYQVYFATDGQPESFTAQAFASFGTTVTVTPDWYAPGLAVTSQGGTVLVPTATVDTTDAPKVYGPYTIKVTTTENTLDGQTPQTGSATMLVQLGEDACGAAQLVPGFGFDISDIDQDCDVDLADFAAFATQWLNDSSLEAPTVY